jgi:hypothetical protein
MSRVKNLGGSIGLQQLRDRGFTDAKIVAMGGAIQGANVWFPFKPGGFDSTGEILKIAPRPRPKTGEEWLTENGPRLWRELHQWALAFEFASTMSAEAWLDRFAARLPCGKCRRHWREIVKANPPTFDSADALFAWTVDRHNDVNVTLGKATMTADEARLEYGG